MKKALLLFIALTFATEGFAAKKDYKGLFGSYRREKFTENEARDSDYGFDILLSTLLPVTSMVKSVEGTTDPALNLSYSTFFNLEGSFFYSLSYHWVLSLNFGYYNYDTRKENKFTQNNLPQTPIFHEYSLKAFPILLGVKYRLSTSDIVPYVGAGVGFAFVTRKGTYDNDTTGQYSSEDKNNVLTAQLTVGLEFYFASRAGIRLEMSGQYFALPETTHSVVGSSGASLAQNPTFVFQANPMGVRYASGLFVLF